MIDESHAPHIAHHCEFPEVWNTVDALRRDDDEWRPPTLKYRPGTRYTCDRCGAVYVLQKPKQVYINVFPSWEWMPETRRQAQRRKGIPRWKFWRQA